MGSKRIIISVTNESLMKRNKERNSRYVSPVVKWYEVAMNNTPAATNNNISKTFWANDEGDRNNISDEEYAAFLAKYNIDVTNSASVDVQQIKSAI